MLAMSASDESARSPGVLIVDDDAGIRENIADLLSTEDYRVYSAADADEALHVLEAEDIDLLVTDFQMPGRNGVELIEAARKANHLVPAILMTAYLYVYEQLDADRRKDITLLRKPFDADEMLREIAARLVDGNAPKRWVGRRNTSIDPRPRPTPHVLLRDFLPIVQESLQADVGQGVLCHLLEDVEWQRDDVRAQSRGLDHVKGVPDTRHQDFAVPIVIPKNLGDFADYLHPFLAHVIEPSDERAHVLRPRLRGEDRLVRGENERRVNLDALRGQGLDRLEPFRGHLNFHDHVLVQLRELAALLDHLLRLGRRNLEGDRAVDEGEDVLDYLGPLSAGLRDERGIRRHPVEDAPGRGLTDLVDVGGVEEDLHHENQPSPKARARYEHFRLSGDVVSPGAGQATYRAGPCGRLTWRPRRSGTTRTS